MQELTVMTSNVGSLFPYKEELSKNWLHHICSVAKEANSVLFVLHLQEFGHKHKLDRNECDRLLNGLREKMSKIYDNMMVFSDLNADDSTIYTALCSIFFWKSSILVEFYDYNKKIHKKCTPENFPKFHYESDEPNTPAKRIKFGIDLFPNKKYSRKGFLAITLKILDSNGTQQSIKISEFTFVNLHLIHDLTFQMTKNNNSDNKYCSVYSTFREKQLSYVLQWLQSIDSENNVIAGDYNFRTNYFTLANELFSNNITLKDDLENNSTTIIAKNKNDVYLPLLAAKLNMIHLKIIHFVGFSYLSTKKFSY